MRDTLSALSDLVERVKYASLREAITEVVRRYETRASANEIVAALRAEIARLETENEP